MERSPKKRACCSFCGGEYCAGQISSEWQISLDHKAFLCPDCTEKFYYELVDLRELQYVRHYALTHGGELPPDYYDEDGNAVYVDKESGENSAEH